MNRFVWGLICSLVFLTTAQAETINESCLSHSWKGTIGTTPVFMEFAGDIDGMNYHSGDYYVLPTMEHYGLSDLNNYPTPQNPSGRTGPWPAKENKVNKWQVGKNKMNSELGRETYALTGALVLSCSGNAMSGQWESLDGKTTLPIQGEKITETSVDCENANSSFEQIICSHPDISERIQAYQNRRATLCAPKEVVVFSCAMPKKKMVSLCARKDDGEDVGYMQYRFGKDQSSVELEYPPVKDDPKKYFKYYSSSFAKGRTDAISFRNSSFRYSLFRTSSAYGYNGAGIILNKGEDNIRVSFSKCHSEPFAPFLHTSIPFYRLQEIFGLPDAGKDVSFIEASAGITDTPDPDSKYYHPKPGEPEDTKELVLKVGEKSDCYGSNV